MVIMRLDLSNNLLNQSEPPFMVKRIICIYQASSYASCLFVLQIFVYLFICLFVLQKMPKILKSNLLRIFGIFLMASDQTTGISSSFGCFLEWRPQVEWHQQSHTGKPYISRANIVVVYNLKCVQQSLTEHHEPLLLWMLSCHLVEDLHRVVPQGSQEAGRQRRQGMQTIRKKT